MRGIRIIGAGLAGSEAAWQCARRGVPVDLYEMRPVRSTPAHQTSDFAELVCSNSLKSEIAITATGQLNADALAGEIARLSTECVARTFLSEAETEPDSGPDRTRMSDPHNLGSCRLYFYDSISPIVEADSIDMGTVYL